MKTYKNLIYKKDLIELCKTAIIEASRHKTKRKSVKRVLNDLNFYSNDLAKRIENGNLNLKEPHIFIKKEYNKERTISASPFYPNQCVDYVLLISGLKKIIISKMRYQAFGNLPNKGCHKASRYLHKKLLKEKNRYFLKFDIEKYYQNIDKDILMNKLSSVIKDTLFISTIKQTIYFNKSSGLPIGSILSQYLALFYLKDIACKYSLNYVDDFLVLGGKKRKLNMLVNKIKSYLATIKLRLNKKTIIYKMRDRFISMVGFRFKNKVVVI